MNTRIGALLASAAAVLLAAATASAAGPYSLTGRVATGSGATVRLPAFGVPCNDIVGNQVVGVNQMQKYRQPITQFSVVLNPGGCLPGSAASVATTGSGGFMLPAMFFSQAAPGVLQVVPVPLNNAVPQLATSFAFTGPNMFNTPYESQRPRKGPYTTPGIGMVMYPGTGKFTPAVWNSFRANAHLTQPSGSAYGSMANTTAGFTTAGTGSNGTTMMGVRASLNMYVSGRTSKDFTACPQPPNMASAVACTFPTQGTIKGSVKNISGAKVFGGTMGLVLTTGPNFTSSVAVTIASGYSSPGGNNTMATRGSILFNALMGMGSRLNGRGYAAYDTDYLSPASIHTMHKLTSIKTSLPYNSRVVGMATVPGSPVMLPPGTNRNHGFPWTTGTQLLRATGKTLNGAPGDGTFSLMGYDNRMTPSGATGMGGEGTIQLVSGGIAAALPLQPFGGTANYSVMRLEFAPEPGAIAGLLAGAGLLGLVAWRSRKN